MTSELYQKQCLKKMNFAFHPIPRPPRDVLARFGDRSLQQSRSRMVCLKRGPVCSERPKPTQLPQFHPIEKYWAIMKRRLKAKRRVVQDINQMKTLMNKIAKTMDEESVRRLMSRMTGKVREFIGNRDE